MTSIDYTENGKSAYLQINLEGNQQINFMVAVGGGWSNFKKFIPENACQTDKKHWCAKWKVKHHQ